MLNEDSTCGSAASSRRQAHLLERRRDVLAPGAGAHDAFAETVGLPELEADVLSGLLEARAARAFGPQLLNALFLFVE